jgi:hypothetical protein
MSTKALFEIYHQAVKTVATRYIHRRLKCLGCEENQPGQMAHECMTMTLEDRIRPLVERFRLKMDGIICYEIFYTFGVLASENQLVVFTEQDRLVFFHLLGEDISFHFSDCTRCRERLIKKVADEIRIMNSA